MKLRPASSARWMIAMLSRWSGLPQAPNIMAPRHSGLTRTPVLPSVRSSVGFVAVVIVGGFVPCVAVLMACPPVRVAEGAANPAQAQRGGGRPTTGARRRIGVLGIVLGSRDPAARSLIRRELPMGEKQRILDLLDRAYRAKAWHGPAMLESLDGVNAALAAKHPVRGAHSIWELVEHVASWNEIVATRLAGKRPAVTAEMNFPPVVKTTPAAWRASLRRLARTQGRF